MFTLDGQLRDEYRELESRTEETSQAAREDTARPPAASPPPPEPAPALPPPRAAGYPEGQGPGPSVLDLIGLLAEQASAFLREVQAGGMDTIAGDSRVEQSLEMARIHIDLLGVLQEKTVGNLSSQEKSMLDDVVYRLQMGYVQVSK